MICAWCSREFEPKLHARPETRYCRHTCATNAWHHEHPETKRRINSAYFARLSGLAYERRKLQVRRNTALYRRRLRSAGADGPGRLKDGG